jgi:hypothetical protein
MIDMNAPIIRRVMTGVSGNVLTQQKSKHREWDKHVILPVDHLLALHHVRKVVHQPAVFSTLVTA